MAWQDCSCRPKMSTGSVRDLILHKDVSACSTHSESRRNCAIPLCAILDCGERRCVRPVSSSSLTRTHSGTIPLWRNPVPVPAFAGVGLAKITESWDAADRKCLLRRNPELFWLINPRRTEVTLIFDPVSPEPGRRRSGPPMAPYLSLQVRGLFSAHQDRPWSSLR